MKMEPFIKNLICTWNISLWFFFFVLFLFLYTRIRDMLVGECFFPCLILYYIYKLRLTQYPNSSVFTWAGSELHSTVARLEPLPSFNTGQKWMLPVERLRRDQVLVKWCDVATWCWHISIHLFTHYLALTAACTLQVLLAARLDDCCS